MDEQALRQQVCQAAQQLWVRRLIHGESGVISAEVNRRRYIVTPAGYRRADLGPGDLLCIDLEGQNVTSGPTELPHGVWQAHQTAYQVGVDLSSPGSDATRQPIHATVLADPPNVRALATLDPEARQIAIVNHADLPVVDPLDTEALSEAITQATLIFLQGKGVFATAASLGTCLNLIETLEHRASIELATRG